MAYRPGESIHDATPPPDVPGYARAVAAGLTPRVPEEPPRRLPGPTAWAVFVTVMKREVAAVIVTVLVIAAVRGMQPPEPWLSLGTLLPGLIWFVVMLRLLNAIGDPAVRELHAGYTTLTLIAGRLFIGSNRRWRETGQRVPWDYSGLWVLSRDGSRVLSAADHRVTAPGFYPSPNRPGELELWTGVVWSGSYRPDPSYRG